MKNESYNGWANWDTWEAFNILTNDEQIYSLMLRDIRVDETPSIIVSHASKQIKVWYSTNDIPKESQVDLTGSAICWAEIINALKE